MKKWGNSLMLILVGVLIGLFIIYLPNRDIIVEDSPQMKDVDESVMKSRETTTLEVLDNVASRLRSGRGKHGRGFEDHASR